MSVGKPRKNYTSLKKKKRTNTQLTLYLICLNRGREESVGNDDVSIVCARKYKMVRMT